MNLIFLNFVKPFARDLFGVHEPIYKNSVHIKAAINWLSYAQDIGGDGGVAAYLSISRGWVPSFIETTGYIIDTFLDCSDYLGDPSLFTRSVRMGDFLLERQNRDGSFISKEPEKKPVIFDTGQDILGLLSLYVKTKNNKYLTASKKASDFLSKVQSKDGNWENYSYGNRGNTYHTRVAWALLRIFEITGEKKYKKTAERNLEWAIKNQKDNGWFGMNNFPAPNPIEPYTHTIAYSVEGFLESYKILHNKKYFDAAKKTADKVLEHFNEENFLPATFDENWKSIGKYSCLTGDAQFAQIWLDFYKITKDKKYLSGARKINKFLKSTQITSGENINILGGIKGSYPIYGDLFKNLGYCRLAYVNWAAKFFVDALLSEEKYK